MSIMESTPRSRFSSTLGYLPPSMGTPARRVPGTPMSARKTLGRSMRAPNNYQYSIHNTPNNIFRSSMSSLSADRPRPNNFQPRASSALRQTFSPGPTPQSTRAFKASTSTVNGGAMGKTGAAHLFDMTIDEPSADLDGEELMKHVPQDPNRQGSVYADEFLAHLCPPGLDDEGRRQWFCIMDLRRLKYAANELFAKKDWKINVTNFAKEYEKSRSLILLRYQLFEFKTIKPTDEMLKKWRAANGIADPDDDTPAKRSQVTSSKRKADDDLPLADSSANKNKRRQVEPDEEQPLAKNKRRAVDDSEADENQPSKLQKSAPSQTKSLFQRLAKSSTASAPSSQASTSQTGPGSLFARAKAATTTASKSVFEDPKASSQASVGNIFEHLSDVSRSESVNNGEDGSESDTDSEADEDTEGKASDLSVVASGGVATPAEGRESTPGRSLFDRMTKDTNGQPIRVLDSIEDKPAAFAPANKTWNPDTPIKFGSSQASSVLSSKPQEPPAPVPFKPMFAKKPETPAPAPAPAPAPGPASKSSFFEATNKDAEPKLEMESKPEPISAAPSAPSSKPEPPSKPASASIFGATTTPTTSGLFGGSTQAKSATPAPPNGVMESSTLFGSSKPVEESAKTSLFGASKPVEAPSATKDASETPKPILFGAASANKPQSLFGASAAPAEEKPKPLFGAASTDDKPKAPLFGSVTADDKPKGTVFGGITSSDDKPKTPLFGASSTASTSAPLFGGLSTAPASAFGNQDIKATESTIAKPLFGGLGSATANMAPAAPSTPLFGASKETPKETPVFGAVEKKTDAPASTPLFGASKPAQASNIFGGSQATTNTSNIFGGSSSSAPPTNTFGGLSNGSSSNLFGASQSTASTTPAPQATGLFGASQANTNSNPGGFSFSAPGVSNPFTAAPAASTVPSSSFSFGMNNNNGESNSSSGTFFFGGNSSNNPTSQGQGNMFNFGSGGGSGTATPPPSGPSINFTGATPMSANPNAGNLFAPSFAGGASTGTSSPFNFGGASSLATTPATGTPEPTTAVTSTVEEKSDNKKSDATAAATDNDGEEKHEQINLTEGGPGEEDEEIIYEVRCKAMKEEKVVPKDGEEEKKDGEGEKPKSAWSIKGLGPLRILKHKTTGSVRILLRGEPRGHVVINALPLPTMEYTPKGKYVVAAFANDRGGLDKWMLMVKTPDAAKALADKIQDVKKENKSS